MCKISHRNSKRLLRKQQIILGDYFFAAAGRMMPLQDGGKFDDVWCLGLDRLRQRDGQTDGRNW